MNKVNINVIKQEKIDNRSNNTGRPVNLKSARQVRLAKQKLYTQIHNAFVSGKKFKIDNDTNNEYMYVGSTSCMSTVNNNVGSIVSAHHGSHVCNIDYIGRTKVTGYVDVLGKRVNVMINLKNVKFDYKFI